MKNLSTAEIVFVEWVDSARTSGWCSPEKDEPLMIHSIGLLVRQTKDLITISTSRCAGGNFVDQLTIPMCSVKRIKGADFQKP